MDILVIFALLFCLATVLRRSSRWAYAQTTLHQIGDAAVAHRALNENADAYANRPAGIFPAVLGTGLRGERNETIVTVAYGPHWRVLRCNLTAEILHPSRLGSLAPLQQEATRDLFLDLSARVHGTGCEVAVRDHVNAAAFSMVARLCFGDGVQGHHVRAMECVMQELFVSVGELIPVLDGSWRVQIMYWRKLRRLMGFLGRQTQLYLPLIEALRQSGSRRCGGGVANPYVCSLLDLRIPDNDASGEKKGSIRRALRDDELISLISEFLGGATGSVVSCVEWTLAHLISRPEVQNRLRCEIDGETNDGVVSTKRLRTSMPYMHAVVLESLRLHPPVPFILRGVHCEGAAAVGVTTVPADGLRVQFVLGDIGRDRKIWTDPDDFQPERFLQGGEAEGVGPSPGPKEIRMLPFGTAHRHCPGTSFAMLQIKCFLAMLVREFEWTPSSEDCVAGIDMTELDGFFKVMRKPLSACVTRRSAGGV